jgi:hypothetical protein
MNLKNAQSLSKCHRPGSPALQDPQILKAVRMVEAVPDLKAALASQVAFDDKQEKIVDSINISEEFLDKIDDTLGNLPKGFQWSALKQPPFLAGAIAVLVMIGVLIYCWSTWMENFPGRDSAEKMVDMIEHMSGNELEPKVTQAGALEDWFFSKGYENFRMLPEIAPMKTVGGRVFKQDGHPVAQVVLENHDSILYIFHSEDFGVQIDPPTQWRVFQQGDWAVAIRSDDDTSFLLAFHGKKAEMQAYVAALHK